MDGYPFSIFVMYKTMFIVFRFIKRNPDVFLFLWVI